MNVFWCPDDLIAWYLNSEVSFCPTCNTIGEIIGWIEGEVNGIRGRRNQQL